VNDSWPGISRRRLMINASGLICCLWQEIWHPAQSSSGTKTLRFSADYPLGELSIVPEGPRPWELAGKFVSQAFGTSTFPAHAKIQLQLVRGYEKSSSGLLLLAKDSLYRLKSGESRVEESWLAKNLPHVTDLVELSLREARISDLLCAIIAPMKKLIDLNLSHTRITKVDSITKLPALKNLLLSFCPISDSTFTSVVLPSHLQKLEIVATKTTAKSAASIAKCPSLTVLDASYTHFDDAALKCLGAKHNWVDLLFRGCAITDAGLYYLHSVPSLSVLELSHCAMSGVGLGALKSIVELRLAHTRMLDPKICSILALMPNLRDIDLSFSSVNPRTLSTLSHLHSLRMLKLSGIKLSGVDLSFFAQNPKLLHLVADRTGIDDQQLEKICQHATNLVQLDVSNNPITDKSISSLAKCIHLNQLTVRATGLSAKGISFLQHQLPNCKILGAPK
jgi:hypothetical protein